MSRLNGSIHVQLQQEMKCDRRIAAERTRQFCCTTGASIDKVTLTHSADGLAKLDTSYVAPPLRSTRKEKLTAGHFRNRT